MNPGGAGFVCSVVFEYLEWRAGRHIDPDRSNVSVVENGTADPETDRSMGMASARPAPVRGAAITQNNGMVFTSGHVVYRLARPDLVTATSTTTTAVPAT